MSVPNLIGGLVLGALAGSLFNNNSSSGLDSAATATNTQASETPEVPKASTDLAQGETNAAATAMEDAAEQERKAALARQKSSQEVFTSPLGVVGQANIQRRQLLGA